MSLIRIKSLFKALPSVGNTNFLARVKEMLDIGSGTRGNILKRWVSLQDLYDPNLVKLLNAKETSVTKPTAVEYDGRLPEPPTSLVIMKSENANQIAVFSHHLTWTVPTDDSISHFEIWYATSNDRSAAKRIGIVTYPQNEYVRANPDPTLDYYYWIRSVGWNGKYSTWEPNDVQGGYVVPGSEALGDAIDRIIDTLKGQDPSVWSGATTYSIGDQVKYVCTDGATRSYESLTDSNLNNAPEGDTTNWKRIGFLATGDVDGVSTVAIDGNLVVDNTILARHIQAGSITANHIQGNTLLISNLNSEVTDRIFSSSDKNSSELTDDANLGLTANWANVTGDGKPENYATLGATWGTNITNEPSELSDINSSEGTKLADIEEGADVTPTLPSDENLVGYWSLDEGDGTSATDSSGNGNDGTLSGDLSWIRGKSGYALETVDGIDDVVTISGSGALENITDEGNAWTMSVWFKPKGLPQNTNDGYIFFRAGFHSGFIQQKSTGDLQVLWWYDDATSTSTTAFSPTIGTWYYLVLTVDTVANELKFFVNGEQIGSTVTLAKAVRDYGTADYHLFGKPSTIYQAYGSVDEARIYNRALTASEIKALYLNPGGIKSLSDAFNAQSIADGKITTFFQDTEPATDMIIGDIWFDTDDGNHIYRYSGSAWVDGKDTGIATAIDNAATAQATADGKVTTFFTTSTPTADAVGDLWYNDSTKILKRWSGSAWVEVANYVTDTNQLTDGALLGESAVWASVTGAGKPADNADVTPGLPSDENLVGYWSLDEGAGTTATDSSGNGNDGTLVNSPSWVYGVSGKALSFDGINGGVSIPNDSAFAFGTDDFSISFWIAPDTLGVENRYGVAITDYNITTFRGFRAGLTNDTNNHPYLLVGDGTVYTRSDFDYNFTGKENEWHHLTFVISRTNDKTYCYIDGEKDAHEGSISTVTGAVNSTGPLEISAPSSPFHGSIDEVRIYNRALLASEIKALYLNPGGLKAPMPGADITADNTANDTANVNSVAAATVQGNAAAAKLAVDNQSSDGVFSVQEKATWRVQWPGMQANYEKVLTQATTWGIETETVFTDFESARNTLYAYLDATHDIWAVTPTDTTITGDLLQINTTAFYEKMRLAVNRLSDYATTAHGIEDNATDNSSWAYPSATTINGAEIETGSITAQAIAAHSITVDKLGVSQLSGISASLGEVTSGLITGAEIRTADTGKRIVITNEGMRLETGSAKAAFGDSSYKFGDSTRKFGGGSLAYINHASQAVPFYVAEETTVGDLHFPNRASTPTGAAEIGDACLVNKNLQMCILAGTPGTWSQLVPIASLITTLDDTVPTGYLECDGSAISRTTYADLYAVIGVMYGSGDGSTTFNLPDLRGRFLRAWDHGAGRDPDSTTRTARADGTAGDNVGTTQGSQFNAHHHTYGRYSTTVWEGNIYVNSAWSGYSTVDTSNTGGNETRSKNINVLYCIKY